MHFTIKFLILIVLSTNLSGCAGLYNCSRITDNPSTFQECQAKNGNQDAQYEMGRIAFDGGDTKTAIKWLRKAATTHYQRTPIFSSTSDVIQMKKTGAYTLGNYDARMLLVKIYEEGIGVEVDRKKADRYRNMK